MKIAICDDEKSCLDMVIAVADEYKKDRSEKKISFEFFSSSEDLYSAAEKIGGYDVYVLDVIMPFMNGIELGLKLREADYDGKIVYLTSSEEYSLDAFRVKAFDYIIKPIKKDVFYKVMDDLCASVSEKKGKSLIVKTKEKSVKVNYDSILFAEFNKRAVCYHLAGGKCVESTTVRTTFSQAMQELLCDPRFYACGQSLVVNLDHVTEVENSAVNFASGKSVYVGEKLCRKLRDVWAEYLFGQEG